MLCVDRAKGLVLTYASQLLPPGDKESIDDPVKFEKAIFGKNNRESLVRGEEKVCLGLRLWDVSNNFVRLSLRHVLFPLGSTR